MKGYIVLEDGTILEGKAFGATPSVMGEIFFHTEMAGYENIFTDPANGGQILVMTYPILGSYGFSKEDLAHVSSLPKAVIVKDFSETPSHWKCEKTLSEFLIENQIFGLSYVDTRLLTRKIRANGNMKCYVTIEEPNENILNCLKNFKAEYKCVEQSSIKEYSLINKGAGKRVGVIDLGSNQGLLNTLKELDSEIHMFPFNATAENILAHNLDAVILTHGGGSPYALIEILEAVKLLQGKMPLYGIGLGALTLAVANHIAIHKMKNGYRGNNYAVQNHANGKVLIVVQNIGFGIMDGSYHPEDIKITFTNVNDNGIEGFKIDSEQRNPVEGILFLAEGTDIVKNWLERGDVNA